MQPPRLSLLVLLFALLPAGTVEAQIYKCVDPATQRINFTDRPCAEGEKAEQIEVIPNTVDTSGSREQVLLQEMAALRERLRQAEEAARTPPRSEADLRAERLDSFDCAQARRAYEREAGSIKPNPDAIDAKRAAMYGSCGLREPDRIEIRQEVVVPQWVRQRPGTARPPLAPVGRSPREIPFEERFGRPTVYPRALPQRQIHSQPLPAARTR